MMNKQAQLDYLDKLLKWKESKSFMANKLNVSLEELDMLLKELRVRNVKSHYVDSPESALASRNIDINSYQVKSGWVKENGMSVQFSQKKVDAESHKLEFLKFLENYTPAAEPVVYSEPPHAFKVNACLILNKQDAHLNKLDFTGDNNIQKRFATFYDRVATILTKAKATANLQNVIYVLGSDEFNSEWTGTTTHGTPQQNIGSYQESFEAICHHEVSVINLLLERSQRVTVLYIPGNHDEHVGWHMVNWLKTYYRMQHNLIFDCAPTYTKYIKYSNSAFCFNHGYQVKPEQLAQNFPIEFKEHWSKCDNFYIFAGDKHTELSRTIGGIKFYRLAQISNTKSKWDHEKGYTIDRGEVTAFLIEEQEGLTDIYHRAI